MVDARLSSSGEEIRRTPPGGGPPQGVEAPDRVPLAGRPLPRLRPGSTCERRTDRRLWLEWRLPRLRRRRYANLCSRGRAGPSGPHPEVGQDCHFRERGPDLPLRRQRGRGLRHGLGCRTGPDQRCRGIRAVINGTYLDYYAESFMAGEQLGGGFVIIVGIGDLVALADVRT